MLFVSEKGGVTGDELSRAGQREKHPLKRAEISSNNLETKKSKHRSNASFMLSVVEGDGTLCGSMLVLVKWETE